jgi:hypothetical protein
MICECGCGKPVSEGRRFVVGHNMHGEDLSDRVFGKITVIKPLKKVTNRRKWLCRCACGKEFARRGSVLLTGKSTGCRSCNNGNLKRPYEGRYKYLCAMALGRATVDLSYEEYLTFTKTTKCYYCGIGVVWKPHGTFSNGHHLDRKDNSLGYSKKNCVVCCPRCNRAKSNHFTYEEWVQIGAVIRSWRMNHRSIFNVVGVQRRAF